MKTIKLSAIAILLLISFSAVFGQKSGAAKLDPTKPIRDAFDRIVEGIKESNAEKTMGVYENSPRILFFNNNGSVTQGWEEMEKLRKDSYSKAKNVSLETTGIRVEILGPGAAYLTCKWKQSQETDGKLETASGRMTIVFKKIGKDWKAVHLHTSPDNPPPTRPVLPSERPTPAQK